MEATAGDAVVAFGGFTLPRPRLAATTSSSVCRVTCCTTTI